MIDPTRAWEPYRPAAKADWDLKKAGHLYRRAGFGATLDELQAAVAAGPEKAVDALLAGRDTADFEKTYTPLAKSLAETNNNGPALKAWWLARMLNSPHPLREKMTLFWHNHFATSVTKPGMTAAYMLGQYDLMYKFALGNFADLLRDMSTDPAMLVWLDGNQSKKGMPNENYAREIMELFSLGVGNYTEKDIREAARAFTGWELREGKAYFNAAQHDDGEKTVIGKTGKFGYEDIVRICLDQPSCPKFIVRKLFRYLVSESIEPTPELIAPLADSYRKSGYDSGKLVETVLRSNLFFDQAAYRTKIKSPVEFALGIVRGLEGKVNLLALAQSLEGLGQNVFAPPNVKGWDGGPAWLNGQTLLARQNLALALTSTADPRFTRKQIDPARVVNAHVKPGDDAGVVAFFLDLFLQGDVPADSRSRLLEYVKSARKQDLPVFWSDDDKLNHPVWSVAHLVLTLPEYQLC